jgi:hypothetical protein
LVILMDVVSGCITFSEAPCLTQKCGPPGVTVLLGLYNHHAEVVASRPNLGCYTPLCRFLVVV